MDTLLVALALLDGRALPVPAYTPAPIVWTLERSASVKVADSAPIQTRVAVAVKTPNIWGE